VDKARLVHEFRPERFTSAPGKSVLAIETMIPALRPNLHFEIGLHGKSHGVVAEPGW
jgi:hypothetical protein